MFCKTRLAVVIATVLAAPGAYSTETVETDEHMEVVGRDYGFKVDTNSTAMRVEATQLETPGQVTVIDEQLIDEQRASTLGNVLKNDSSISAGGVSRNRESFKLRGFDLESSSGFLRDGKQHWSHYRQPIELLERVEVLKGPAGLLYGKSAPGGLVNMVAKKPTYETQVNISQDLGSNNDSRTTVDVSGSLNDAQTLRARAVVSKQSYDSWRTYADGSTPSTERFVGGLFVDYDLNDKVTLSVHYDKTNDNGSVDSGAYIDLDTGKPVGGDELIWDAQWSTIENDVENAGFDIAAQLSDNWDLKIGYNNQDFRRNDVESGTTAGSYIANGNGTVTYKGFDRRDHWVFNTAFIDFVGEFDALGMQHQTLVGANWLGYYYSKVSYSGNSTTGTIGEPLEKDINYSKASTSLTERDSYGLYVQDMVTVNDQWQVLAGLRFDREVNDKDTYNNLLPKLGLIYHPKSNGSIYATYSESFEPKDAINDTDDINHGMELDPVKGRLYELGSKWELMDNQLFVSGAIFDITQENIVISQNTGNNPGNLNETETTQAGKQVHRGAEFSAMGYVTEAVSLSGSMTYLDATIHDEFDPAIDGNRPADVPEFSASVWSRYSFANNTDVNLGAIYVGERFGDEKNEYKKDAYTRFDTGIAHTINYDKDMDLVLRFNIENLFDTDYLAGGSQSKTIIGEGRNYMASIQLRY
ncbi:TonB-dependent siderophore receptor [Moritella sp. F3]|uniref:TonB-dependent siderophore receptor n=1 Tax=Moritella sp. F3 TaxID=2718882 RepID=UPI0018E1160A|nr:TonB-dependent siderophore receptor [Moritella sp. F3]GIC78204.1 ligand-gated channel protein [Moritella sp. F1]GIC81152.1 ligand-gated channel protein [Moritella sp. F3]